MWVTNENFKEDKAQKKPILDEQYIRTGFLEEQIMGCVMDWHKQLLRLTFMWYMNVYIYLQVHMVCYPKKKYFPSKWLHDMFATFIK